jgi:hypothetical protein
MKNLFLASLLLASSQLLAQEVVTTTLTPAHKMVANTQVGVIPADGMNPTKDGFNCPTMRVQISDMRVPFTNIAGDFTAVAFELRKQKLLKTERLKFNNYDAIWVESEGIADISLKYSLCVGNAELSKLMTVNMIGKPDEATQAVARKLLMGVFIKFNVENQAKFSLDNVGTPFIMTKSAGTATEYTMATDEKCTISIKKLPKNLEGSELKTAAAAQIKELGGKVKQADVEMRKFNNMVGCEASTELKGGIKVYQAIINAPEGGTFVLQAKGTEEQLKDAKQLMDTFTVK